MSKLFYKLHSGGVALFQLNTSDPILGSGTSDGYRTFLLSGLEGGNVRI